MSTNIKIIKCKGELISFGYESDNYFQMSFGHELGSVYCNFRLKDSIQFEGKTVKNIYIHSGLQSYIENKKGWFNGKRNLTISFDEWEWSKDGKLAIGGENLEIKKKGSSSHSATVDRGNTLWLEEETNHNHGTEAEEAETNDTVKPNPGVAVNPGTVDNSDKVDKIREIFNEGNNIVNSNDVKDVSAMKKSIRELENIKNSDSPEKEEAFSTFLTEDLVDELIRDLKGKVEALEEANQQSDSSQPDQPVQPSQDEILASIQRENEAKKNTANNKLNQAESENATKEEVAEAVKGSASNFGDENFQEQQKRQEVLEEKLAVEDFELYLKTMIEKVSLCLEENKLKETDLKLTNELRSQWTRLNRKVIQDKDQVKVIVQQMQEQIIRQANEKELNSIHERVEKNKKKLLPENERKKLKDDIVRYLEKTKTNAYTKSNVSKGEALLREFNSISEPKTTNPNKFPWVPVSLGIGTVGILAVAALIIKKRKQRSR